MCEFIKKKKIEEEIVDKIKTLFGINVKINFKYNESLKIEDYEKIKLNENLKIVQNALSNTQIKNEISKPKEVKKKIKSQNTLMKIERVSQRVKIIFWAEILKMTLF